MNKILVVEDSQEVLNNITQLLKIKGYETFSAINGKIGLDIAKTELPDLIISDIMMPIMDGYEFLDELKKNSTTAFIPLIFLTAKTDKSEIRKGMIRGANDYITKPFKVNELLESIETRIKLKRKNEEVFEEIYNNISNYIPHELRTPLVAILGFSDLMISEYNDFDANDMKEMLNRIKFAGKRLYKTVEKFIKYSEIEILNKNKKENTKFLRYKSIIGKDIALNSLFQLKEYHERKNDIEIEIEHCEIYMFNEHLQILIDELIENAMKFSAIGDKIKIVGKEENDKYILSIIDDGIGMTSDEISKIKPFIQHNRNIYEQNGNGLGLITVKKIIDFYGCKLKINSELNQFTNISIYLEK